MSTLRLRADFQTVLRDSLAEVRDAEAIDAADARQASDGVERLRLEAAHLVSTLVGGPWPTGAAVRFAPEQDLTAGSSPAFDIRFPELPAVGQPELDGSARPPRRVLPRQGRRIPDDGTQGE